MIQLPSMTTSDMIAGIALSVSTIALGWNIVRDLFMDRVKVSISASVGELQKYPGSSTTGMFRDADTEFKPQKPSIAFYVTNMGRRPVGIAKIQGTYRKAVDGKPCWIFHSRELPKLLQPYESVTEINDAGDILAELENKNLGKVYVVDTKGKKWALSWKARRRLEWTAMQARVSK